MILNPLSVAAAFLTLVEAALALAVCVRSAAALRALGRARTSGEHDAAEVGALRPALLAAALVVVVLGSGALLVAVLASYVTTWPTVFCIEGVTRIGLRNTGPAGHLPWLVALLFVTKPALVLLGGAWVTVHAVVRTTARRPGRLGPAILLALGVLALVDAAAEFAYLAIPKTSETLATGCCTYASALLADPGRSWLERVAGSVPPPWAFAALVASALVVGAPLLPLARRYPTGGHPSRSIVALAILGAGALSVAAQHVYVAVVSPRMTGISTHRCGWCVLQRAYEWLAGERPHADGPATAAVVVAAAAVALCVGSVLLTALAAEVERSTAGVDDSVRRRCGRAALTALVVAVVSGLLAAV